MDTITIKGEEQSVMRFEMAEESIQVCNIVLCHVSPFFLVPLVSVLPPLFRDVPAN